MLIVARVMIVATVMMVVIAIGVLVKMTDSHIHKPLYKNRPHELSKTNLVFNMNFFTDEPMGYNWCK